MEAFQHYVTVSLPRYLKSLPLPKDIEGFSKLNQEEWIKLVPFFAVIVSLVVVILTSVFTDPSKKWQDEAEVLRKQLSKAQINHKISKNEEKVATTCPFKDIEECEKKVFCRCWKSEKFPYCDGTHVKHNKETGDNVGPLIVLGGKS